MEIPSMFSARAVSARFFRVASNDKHLPLRSEIIQNQKFEDSLNMVSPLTAFDPILYLFAQFAQIENPLSVLF